MLKFPKNKHKRKKKQWIPLNKLDDQLWRVFSQYIRLRDSDVSGYVSCITCGRKHYWSSGKIHCGHFVQRDKKAVKFNVHNNSGQCDFCNTFRGGEQFKHGRALDRKWGPGTADKLMALSQVSHTKLGRLWYESMIEEYRQKVKQLKSEKDFRPPEESVRCTKMSTRIINRSLEDDYPDFPMDR